MQWQNEFVTVERLKHFVQREARRIEIYSFTTESIRLLADARRFLDMLYEPKYVKFKKVSELVYELKGEYRELLKESAELDKFLPGYQFTLFEDAVCVTDEQMKLVRAMKFLIDEELLWLRKCLEICHDKEYFR